jgi:eukaryotic-like serine/threonine-protein kinase
MSAPTRTVGRYAIYGEIAMGGMATVHYGRLLGPVGFARTVAIKRLHPQFARDPEFVAMFLDEARLAARIQHPNVCATLDIVTAQGELLVVLEYLRGETLARLMRNTRQAEQPIEPAIAASIVAGTLHGLHAAHEAHNERGVKLGIVHRDVSPQNILVGVDGVSRVLDFGVAKAAGRLHTTQEAKVKGKLPYMAPEQLRGGEVDRQSDVYSAAVCLWEALAGRKLFAADNEGLLLQQVLLSPIDPPSKYVSNLPYDLEEVVMRGLERDKSKRFASAKEMALALQRAIPPALSSDVGEWVESIAENALSQRAARITQIESSDPDIPAFKDLASELARSGEMSAAAEAPVSGSQSSQLSNISAIAKDGSASTSPERSRKRLFIGVGSAVALSAIGLVVILSAASGSRSAASAPSEAPASAAMEAPTPPATEPHPTAAPAPLPPPTTTSDEKPVVTKAPAANKPFVPKTYAPGDDCRVPYTVGPSGERIYKRKCL